MGGSSESVTYVCHWPDGSTTNFTNEEGMDSWWQDSFSYLNPTGLELDDLGMEGDAFVKRSFSASGTKGLWSQVMTTDIELELISS